MKSDIKTSTSETGSEKKPTYDILKKSKKLAGEANQLNKEMKDLQGDFRDLRAKKTKKEKYQANLEKQIETINTEIADIDNRLRNQVKKAENGQSEEILNQFLERLDSGTTLQEKKEIAQDLDTEYKQALTDYNNKHKVMHDANTAWLEKSYANSKDANAEEQLTVTDQEADKAFSRATFIWYKRERTNKSIEVQELKTQLTSAGQSLQETEQSPNKEIAQLSEKYKQSQKAYNDQIEKTINKDAEVYNKLRRFGEDRGDLNDLELSMSSLRQEIAEIDQFMKDHPAINVQDIEKRVTQRNNLISQFLPLVGNDVRFGIQFDAYQQEQRQISPQIIDGEESYSKCKNEISEKFSTFREKEEKVQNDLLALIGQIGNLKRTGTRLAELEKELSQSAVVKTDRNAKNLIKIKPESWEDIIQNRQEFLAEAQKEFGINVHRDLNDSAALDSLKDNLAALNGRYTEGSRPEIVRTQGIIVIDYLKGFIAKKNEQERLERDRTELPAQIITGINEVVPIMKAMDESRTIHNQRIKDINTYRMSKQQDLEAAEKLKVEDGRLSERMQKMLNYSIYSIEKILGKKLE